MTYANAGYRGYSRWRKSTMQATFSLMKSVVIMQKNEQNFFQVQEAVAALQEKAQGYTPKIGIVLGTGLGGLAATVEESTRVPYTHLPHFPKATVASHEGCFVLGKMSDSAGHSVDVILQQGRCHLYEGYSPADVCMGVRTMAGLGIENLIICSATGALNPQFDTGDLMLMTDHINLTGQSPLTGENVDAWGVRFPDMSKIYDENLRKLCLESALQLGTRLERGVYAGVLGPQMESPAETRYLRQMGADAVGMSTVLEVIAARHLGLRVLGIACLCNKNLPDCMAEVPLEEVIAVAKQAEAKLTSLVRHVVMRIQK